MFVKKMNDVEKEIVSSGEKTYKQVLISPDEAPNFAMRRFIIEPGGSMPFHTNTVEHEQLVLNGRAKVIIGENIYEVEKNDIVFIPSGMPHSYEVIGKESFEFLCMVPNKSDVINIV